MLGVQRKRAEFFFYSKIFARSWSNQDRGKSKSPNQELFFSENPSHKITQTLLRFLLLFSSSNFGPKTQHLTASSNNPSPPPCKLNCIQHTALPPLPAAPTPSRFGQSKVRALRLGANQKLRRGTKAAHLVSPLGFDGLIRGRADNGIAEKKNVRRAVDLLGRDGVDMVLKIFLACSVPQTHVKHFPINTKVEGAARKHTGNIIPRETIGGEREEETGLPDRSIPNRDTFDRLHFFFFCTLSLGFLVFFPQNAKKRFYHANTPTPSFHPTFPLLSLHRLSSKRHVSRKKKCPSSENDFRRFQRVKIASNGCRGLLPCLFFFLVFVDFKTM